MLHGLQTCILHALEGLPLTYFHFTKMLFAPLRENIAMQLGFTDTVTVFGHSIMVISLSMYVMAACIFTLQGTLFLGRPGPF